MAFVIGLINQKGGVGKTTLSVNIAAELARRGNRVLLVDADPQGSALDWSEAREGEALFPVIGIPRATLHRDLEELKGNCDFVVIDGAPRVTKLVRSSAMASDLILIPVQPSPYDVWAADEIVGILEELQVGKPALQFAFLVNRRIAKTAIGRDIGEALSSFENVPVLESQVTQRVVFAESAAGGKAVFEIEGSPRNGTREIESLVDEILGMLEVK